MGLTWAKGLLCIVRVVKRHHERDRVDGRGGIIRIVKQVHALFPGRKRGRRTCS